ncbi:hypothetical protein O181_091718 [Austropuccinia psidii MF-1]|uniref:Uncharacterized protein n=1 Tax=Austropuccinia psidii MF-1 TaxID=1389203 RepID=A0A9Q3P7R8_9BASI|nr:hypothetical protein [Austropuccinia psidii MF-1]
MNTNDQNNDLQRTIPILTNENYSEWKTFAALFTSEEITQNSYLLWRKVNERFASSTFNSKARYWSKFQKLTYDDNLKDFIANTQKCLNYISAVGINVEDEILAFSILTKLPEEFHSLIEKVTLNAETQGNPDAILNVLHEAALKEEALSIDTTRALILKKTTSLQRLSITAATENIILSSPHMDQKNVGSYILN